MTALIIVLISLTIFLLIPVGIDAGFSGGELVLGLKIGPFNIKLYPRRKKEKLLAKPPKEKRVKKEKKRKKPEKEKKELDLSQILDIIRMGLRALGRFRRKLRIDYIRFICRIVADDPFQTVMYSSAASAAVSALFPLLEDTFNVRERDFEITPDFFYDKTELDIWLTTTLHILDIFHIAIAFGMEFLIFYIKQKRFQSKNERNEING